MDQTTEITLLNGSNNASGSDNPSVEGDLSKSTHILDITIRALGIPLGLTVLVGNILFIIVIAKAKQPKCFHNTLVIHLAVSDLIAGLTLLINLISEWFYRDFYNGEDLLEGDETSLVHHILCRAWGSFQFLPIYHAFLLLCIINLDRLIAVTYPATYASNHKTRVAQWLPILVWLYSTLICALALSARYGTREHHITDDWCGMLSLPPLYVTMTSLIHVPLATLIGLGTYLQIRRILRIHQRKIQVTNTMTYDNLVRDTAIARTDFCVAITAFIVWAPFMTSLLLWYSSYDRYTMVCVIKGTLLLGYLSSLRFIAFIVGSCHYKESFFSLLHCRKHHQQGFNRRGRLNSRGP